ncbi:MAG: division/cell wall cluster transcriptional repressor MraZ [Saprospiraceae bacterium]|nr:division/cell wall cluster transcriptional repressor MraZ [Saprospiraceae bacterium]
MYNLKGEYRIKIDEKGRIKLPKDLIRQLNHDVALPLVINRGYEKHLMLYPKDVWERKTKEINRLNINKSKERQAIRYFYRGASELELDNIERVLIPSALLEYASVEKDVVLFAYNEQIELWDANAYLDSLEKEPDNFGEIMESISNLNNLESTEHE